MHSRNQLLCLTQFIFSILTQFMFSILFVRNAGAFQAVEYVWFTSNISLWIYADLEALTAVFTCTGLTGALRGVRGKFSRESLPKGPDTGARKAKAYLEMDLARVVKGNQKPFCKHSGSSRKSRENVVPLRIGGRDLVTNDMEKAEVLGAFIASVLTGKTGFQESQAFETRGEVWSKAYPQWRRRR